MENLPLDIEQKIENLPIVPFDESEDFQKILFCADFNDIFSFYKENYLPDTLKAKPEIYQRVSLYLTLTGQGDAFTEQTDSVLYRRPVPPIEEFLSNKFFMGYSNATLYPYWKEKLEEIFKTGSPIRKVIFSGCIGCLTKDTIIATLNGDKTIEELLDNYDNEWVLSYNTTTNTWEPDKIIDVFYTGHRDAYEITLDNDAKIRCTDNHQFLTRKNKWVSIKDGTLVPGLSMMPCSDPKLKAKENHECKESFNREIKSIRSVGKEDVYDITTKKNHNFALKSGIIAHNSGKSTVARKAFVYVLYRILCLRYPRATFNIDEDATIANVIISMTLRQVYDTNILPFVKLMESMPCFQRVMSQRSFENFDLTNPNCPIPFVCEKSTGNIYFPDNIIITCGSNQGHFTGYNVVNSFCFTGDTKVYTNRGIITFVSLLHRFKKGYKFKTYCIDRNGIKKEVNIIDVQETRKVTELIKIYYDDDKYITCTPDHPFVISNPSADDPYIRYENGVAYKQAQYLTEEDEIASENQSYVYELIDNRPDSKNFNLPFYVGVSSHSNMISSVFNTQYSRAATHFTAKALRQDPNIIKKSIIKDILSKNFVPEIKIVKTAITLNEAYALEKQLIQQYGKRSNGSGILANLSDGGEGTPFLPAEIVLRKGKKISETKQKQYRQKIIAAFNWLSDVKNLYYVWLVNEIHKIKVHERRKRAASTPKRIEMAKEHIIAYNKSERHRKRTAELNHLFPKVHSEESRLKLAKSQSLRWSKKTEKEKKEANLAKSMGRAWNVLKRIDGVMINENIFNSYRSTGSRLANTEPVWKTITNKAGGVEAFLSYVEKQFGRKFVYED